MIAPDPKSQGELRRKCEEMTAEINKMNAETEQHNKDNQTYTHMERKVRHPSSCAERPSDLEGLRPLLSTDVC